MYRYLTIGVALLEIFIIQGCLRDVEPAATYETTKFTSAARHRSTMRCYTVLGRTYRPTFVKVGQKMRGIASWYGPNFHGKYTSNGERYNMYAKTAAHKTWPMDTMVRVTNLQNGRSTVVRINDRGPFVRGRVIDCSYAAGKELGLDKSGIAKVELEVVGFAGKVTKSSDKSVAGSSTALKQIRLRDFGIQLGAFRRKEGAIETKRRFVAKEKIRKPYRVEIRKAEDKNGTLYRVWLLGFDTEEAARVYRECRGMNGPIVRP